MLCSSPVGIVSYGTHIPGLVVPLSEIEKSHHKPIGSVSRALKVKQKTIPNQDEDTITMAYESALQALERDTKIDKEKIQALFVGSESHPYAVKPSGSVLINALGLSHHVSLADLQFACKAGTQALQICFSYVLSGMAQYGLAIGSDTAQSKVGDVLEYTAAAGAAGFIVGNDSIILKLLATNSYATDTPDFWRKPMEEYPQHTGRFTGEPAYFHHIEVSAKKTLEETGLKSADIDFCIFHTPNGIFPRLMARKLGFTDAQLLPGLIVENIGNCYAAMTMLALSAVLDVAEKNQKILLTSYGSGAGADSFLFETTELLAEKRNGWQDLVAYKISNCKSISYHEYISLIDRK